MSFPSGRALIASLLALIGLGLFAINVYGLVADHPQPPRSAWDMGPADRSHDRPTRQEMTIGPDESRTAFFERITRLIDAYFIHYGGDAATGEPPDRSFVPIWDNYILWALTQLGYNYFNERANVERALARGYGQCSQFALIIAGILDRNGIPARIIRLSGHVVAAGQTEAGDWQILDANYGVTLPYAIEEIEARPEIVEAYYRDVYRRIPEAVRLPMTQIYGPEGNRVFTIEAQQGWKAYWIERASPAFAWSFPALAWLGAAALLADSSRRRHGLRPPSPHSSATASP